MPKIKISNKSTNLNKKIKLNYNKWNKKNKIIKKLIKNKFNKTIIKIKKKTNSKICKKIKINILILKFIKNLKIINFGEHINLNQNLLIWII